MLITEGSLTYLPQQGGLWAGGQRSNFMMLEVRRETGTRNSPKQLFAAVATLMPKRASMHQRGGSPVGGQKGPHCRGGARGGPGGPRSKVKALRSPCGRSRRGRQRAPCGLG